MIIKEKDFVEIDYTGMLKDDGVVFDTSLQDIAQKNGLFDPQRTYKPVVICIGQHYLIEGIDKNLIGKDIGKHRFTLPPEDAFGRKNAKLMKLIPVKKFTKEGITPQAGMPVTVDGAYGTIRTVSSGRTIVDFNHPLSGKELTYEVTIHKIVDKDIDKLMGLVDFFSSDVEARIDDKGTAILSSEKPVAKDLAKNIEKKILELIPSIKKVDYIVTKKPKKEAHTGPVNKEKTAPEKERV